MRASIPKFSECYPFLINCLGVFWERGYFVHFSENIKCGDLEKNGVIFHNEGKRVTI